MEDEPASTTKPQFRSQRFVDSTAPVLLIPPGSTSTSATGGGFQNNKPFSRSAGAQPLSMVAGASRKRAVPLIHSTYTAAAAVGASAPDNGSSCIPELPPFHILERTCLRLPWNSIPVPTLKNRLMDFLRLQSITYSSESNDGRDASGRLECTTATRLFFVIQLWRSADQQEILMEVQRQHGCTVEMNNLRRKLYKDITTPAGQQQPPSAFVDLSDNNSNNNSHDDNYRAAIRPQDRSTGKRQRTFPPHQWRLNCEESLQITLQLMESSMVDQQQLGWESLAFLTNRMFCSDQDAQQVARSLILGRNTCYGIAYASHKSDSGERLHLLLETVFATANRENSNNHGSGSSSNSNTGNTASRNAYYYLALQSLANALEQVTPNTLRTEFWQTVVQSLVQNMEQAVCRPQEAAWSAKCLRLLFPTLKMDDAMLDSASLQSIANRAMDYGKTHHLCLERETSSLLQTMSLKMN